MKLTPKTYNVINKTPMKALHRNKNPTKNLHLCKIASKNLHSNFKKPIKPYVIKNPR